MENYFRYLTNFDDKSWGLQVITCGYLHYGPGDPYPISGHPKSHVLNWTEGRKLNGSYLIYIPTGRGEFESEKIKRSILPGDVIRLYPNEWHRYRPDPSNGWEEYWIGFEGPAIQQYLIESLFPDHQTMITNIGHHDEVIFLFNQAIQLTKKKSKGFTKILTGIIFQLIAYIESPGYQANAAKTEDQLYETTISSIRQHLKEGVDFHLLADQYGLSYSHFRKLFKKKTGLAPQQFLIQERINYARRLLTSTSLTVDEVAHKCGFQSVFYFSRLFKAKMGVPPGRVRKQD